jgi:pseudomonalisin
MKRLLSTYLAVASVLMCYAQAHAASFPGFISRQAAWVPTATRATQLGGAMPMAALAPNTILRINVALAMRDRTDAEILVRRETTPGDPLYGTQVTPAQYTAMFNPTSAQANAVAGYLAKSGFTNITIEPNHLLVSATGSAAVASAAFHTSFGVYNVKGRLAYANTTPAYVPVQFAGTVLAVLGLNNAYQMTPALRRSTRVTPMTSAGPRATPPPCVNPGPICLANSYTGQGFQKAYDAANTPTGGQTSIAVFAEGNVSQVVTDLRTYESAFGLPQVPYSVRPVGIPSPDIAGLIEWDLDTQSSTGIAQTVKHLYVYDTTSLSDSDVALEVNHFVTDNLAKIGNASFGICESFAFLDGSMLVDDEEFLEGAAQGQTVFSSTGDNGNGCPVIAATGVPGTGVPENSYPATSPYVIGVGGTTLFTNSPGGTYNSEVTWMGGGGGVSQHDGSPYWQSGIVPIVYRTVGKTLPDISMDGDPNTGAVIYMGGTQQFVGGTSLSSPLAMGSWARLMTCHRTLGFAGPPLYHVYNVFEPCNPSSNACTPPIPPAGALTQLIGGFHDVLTGSNGAPYGTLPGYDLETGLGTIDIFKMNQVI